MNITDCLTHLQELLVLLNRLLVLSKVVVEYTSGVVGSTLISGFASSFAGEGEDIIIFQALLRSDTVIRVSIGHVQSAVVLEDTCG